MTQPNPAPSNLEIVEKLEQLRLFLNGEGELQGLSFGDVKTIARDRTGAFWWRREYLPLLTQAASTISRLICERDSVRSIMSRWLNVGFLADQTYLVQLAQALGMIGDGPGYLERTDPAEARAVAAEARLQQAREGLEFYRDAWTTLHQPMVTPVAADAYSGRMEVQVHSWVEPSDRLKEDKGDIARSVLSGLDDGGKA